MNNAIYFENDISNEQYQMAVRVLEAMNIAVKKTVSEKPSKQDDTKMTEQEFYDMIEQRLKTPINECRVLDETYRKELFG